MIKIWFYCLAKFYLELFNDFTQFFTARRWWLILCHYCWNRYEVGWQLFVLAHESCLMNGIYENNFSLTSFLSFSIPASIDPSIHLLFNPSSILHHLFLFSFCLYLSVGLLMSEVDLNINIGLIVDEKTWKRPHMRVGILCFHL